MSSKNNEIMVYRCFKWISLKSDQLLPGDLISIKYKRENNTIIPCDLLLMRGQIIVNEATLTGETIPQMKEPINISKENLQLDGKHKIHILFSGTTILSITKKKKKIILNKLCATFYALAMLAVRVIYFV